MKYKNDNMPFSDKLIVIGLTLFVLLIIFVGFGDQSNACAAPIHIKYKSQEIKFNKGLPFIYDNRTLIPLRSVAETFKYKVTWYEETQTIACTHPDYDIVVICKIDNNTAYINSHEIKLDTAPLIRDNITYVPLRFITEAFGKSVSWNNKTRTVTIKDLSQHLY